MDGFMKRDSHGKSGFSCGKTELFHNLHRFIHKGFPHRQGKGIGKQIYIKLFDTVRQNKDFFGSGIFHNG